MIKTKPILTFTFLSILIGISGCKILEGSEASNKKQEVKVNCYAADFKTTTDYFRATTSATETDESLAKDKALLYSKKAVVSAISSVVQSATSRFIDQSVVGKKQNFKEIFIPKINAKIKEVLTQELTDYTIICKESTQLKNGNYKADIAIEVSKRAITDKINSKLSSGGTYSELFDAVKFEQLFNEELQKVVDKQKSLEENSIK